MIAGSGVTFSNCLLKMPYGESGVPAGFLLNAFGRKAKLITQNSRSSAA